MSTFSKACSLLNRNFQKFDHYLVFIKLDCADLEIHPDKVPIFVKTAFQISGSTTPFTINAKILTNYFVDVLKYKAQISYLFGMHLFKCHKHLRYCKLYAYYGLRIRKFSIMIEAGISTRVVGGFADHLKMQIKKLCEFR